MCGGRGHSDVSGWHVCSSPRMRLVSWKAHAFRVGTEHDVKGIDFLPSKGVSLWELNAGSALRRLSMALARKSIQGIAPAIGKRCFN